EGLLQPRELLVAADEPRLHAELRALASLLRSDPERLPPGDRLRLPLEVERRDLSVLDHVLRRREHTWPDEHPPGFGGRLEPGGRVHGVAGEHPVAASARALHIDA